MTMGPGRRALSFAYLVSFSALAAVLVLLGFAVEGTLPRSVGRRYRRAMLSALATLARPVDGLTAGAPDPVAGSVSRESAP